MNLFLLHYESLLSYAGAVIRNNNLRIEATDLVNDAYIKFVESKKEFNKADIRNLIINISRQESSYQHTVKDASAPKKHYTTKEERRCNKCGEVKPANAFYMNVRWLENVCKSCRGQRRKELYKISGRIRYTKQKTIPIALQLDKERKRKPVGRKKKYTYNGSPRSKEANTFYFKAWLTKEGNREKFNSYMKERLKQQRETLADSYIKTMLNRRGIVLNPENIEAARQKILEKRGRKKAA